MGSAASAAALTGAMTEPAQCRRLKRILEGIPRHQLRHTVTYRRLRTRGILRTPGVHFCIMLYVPVMQRGVGTGTWVHIASIDGSSGSSGSSGGDTCDCYDMYPAVGFRCKQEAVVVILQPGTRRLSQCRNDVRAFLRQIEEDAPIRGAAGTAGAEGLVLHTFVAEATLCCDATLSPGLAEDSVSLSPVPVAPAGLRFYG